jgi:hypothetical protein
MSRNKLRWLILLSLALGYLLGRKTAAPRSDADANRRTP